jgi:hypothetical protein
MKQHSYVEAGADYRIGIDFEMVVDWEDRIANFSKDAK